MRNQGKMLNGFKLEKKFQHVTVLNLKSQSKLLLFLAALKYFPDSSDKVNKFLRENSKTGIYKTLPKKYTKNIVL